MKQWTDLGLSPGSHDSQARVISAPKQLPPPSQLLFREANSSFRYCIYNKHYGKLYTQPQILIVYFVLSDCFATIKGREKRKKASGVQLMFFFAETPVKDWCQEPKTSPLFQVFSGIMRETKHHHALVIIEQNTRRGEYSDDLPGWEFPNYEQVVFQMFAWRKLFRIMNASYHGCGHVRGGIGGTLFCLPQ